MLGSVLALYVSLEGEQKRQSKERLEVALDGVCGDKFKGKDTQRSVLLVASKSYHIAQESGIKIAAGELGENILLDFDPYSFEPGTQLQIGEVVLEIAQRSSLCASLSKISSKLPKLLKNKRGIFAKVISEGCINKDDGIFLNK